MNTIRQAQRAGALWAVLIVAFGLRVYGFWFGLPYVLTGDGENAFIVPAVRMVVGGDLNPHWFGHPGSTVIYPLALLYGLIYVAGHAAGQFDQPAALQALLTSDPTLFYATARLLSIAWAVATVALVWLLGKRLGGHRLGLLAALCLAVNPMHREWTTWARSDAPAAFFVTLGIYAAIRFADHPSRRWALIAGAATGLAASTKITTGVVFVAWLVAWLTQRGRGRKLDFGAFALAALAAAVAFALTSPYVLLDWPHAIPNLLFENRGGHAGAERLPGLQNWGWYVAVALPGAVGWPAILLAIVGLVTPRRSSSAGRGASLILLAFPLLYWLGIGASNLRWDHWLVPALPVVALWSAQGVQAVTRALARAAAGRSNEHEIHLRPSGSGSKKRMALSLSLAALLLLTLGQPLFTSLRRAYQSAQPDTQILAIRWFAEHVPAQTVVGSEWYTGLFWSATIKLEEVPTLGRSTPEYFRERGARFVVGSSDIYDRFYAEPARYADVIAAYERFWRELPLVIELKPDPWRRPGPTIRILRVTRR
ncbi:MAG: glycosyltransferase family 39 protein [Anaerolineae bacterium]|uniref:ArnT family glycosyltransferase n=1 Tax=Candidatus Amarolinea dominans TaxID=3140696 RepID=UPI0031347EB4|nr:glycosyltransferase family 39 protein [Anaerolineae bacterium]MBK9234008.1 glycosyltransferase family 39 protein [Anaerolineae bacterium]